MPGEALADMAVAIAKAEGFFGSSGDTLPRRRNNPGAITGPDGKLEHFDSVQDGWLALEKLLHRIVTGNSVHYNLGMSIREMAVIYTGNDKPDAWARIVSGELRAAPDTLLRDVLV